MEGSMHIICHHILLSYEFLLSVLHLSVLQYGRPFYTHDT
jgi:hypothetical protein